MADEIWVKFEGNASVSYDCDSSQTGSRSWIFAVQGRPSNVFESTQEPVCGYMSCPQTADTLINVHLVPHTHDDVGWLKTVDQYYYGSRNDIQHAGVQYILDSVIPELINDPNKRFIYVEIAFFARWWREQNAEMQQNVRQLVQEGRLEFVLGGWCMNDEASTHYNAMIDQHTLGFSFLDDQFGKCGRPRIGWQIDPFGHSREQASMFAQFGFDGAFFGRLDYQDKDNRLKNKNMEFVWRGSPKNLGDNGNLFTGVLYNHYVPPPGFCWDELCQDEPMMDDERLHDLNVEKRAKDFIKYAQMQAEHYHSNNIMMTMGSDFQYQNAHSWFKNMDKLIKYVNLQQANGSNVNVIYSTPSCYLFNVNHLNQIWNSTEDDFFPYANKEHSFWSGYFTSRAALKDYARKSNNFLQVCKQLDVLADLWRTHRFNTTENLRIFKEALGVVQHHDAISGTEKQHVAYDYAQRLAEGSERCKKVTNTAFGKLLPKGSVGAPEMIYCDLMNISKCEFTETNKQFVMTVYNPLARPISHYVHIPVAGIAYNVTDYNGESVLVQLVPVSSETKNIPERNGSVAERELVFEVQVPPLGFSSYFIRESNKIEDYYSQASEITPLLQNSPDVVIENKYLSLHYDGKSGMMKYMINKEKGINVTIDHGMYYYLSHPGNNSKPEFQASGAYVFRNLNEANKVLENQVFKESYIVKGELVQEAHFLYGSGVSQVVRIYKDAKYAEYEWTVGPINITDKKGKEYISRFTTSLKNEATFHTNANGREFLERRLDYRSTWNFSNSEPVAGNYYPVNSHIYIKERRTDIHFMVLTDRSQGGSSLREGEIELMVHRRTLYDDNLGVAEALNETGADGKGLIVRGRHIAILDTVNNTTPLHRELALKMYMAPSISFSPMMVTPEQWRTDYNTKWSALRNPLPDNVHMLTLEQWKEMTIEPLEVRRVLLRFEHIYERDEDPVLSQPAAINLEDFTAIRIARLEEFTLGANLPLAELNRLGWVYMPHKGSAQKEPLTKTKLLQTAIHHEGPYTNVTLQPFQIRTFIATLADPIKLTREYPNNQ